MMRRLALSHGGIGSFCKRNTTSSIWAAYKKFINYSFEEITPVELYPTNKFSTWKTFKLGGSSCTTTVVEEIDGDTKQTYLRFAGNVVATNNDIKGGPRASFCATTSYCSRPIDLRDHQGLELYIRANQRLSIGVNMGCFSMIDGDLYQLSVEVPGGVWTRIQLPFQLFR